MPQSIKMKKGAIAALHPGANQRSHCGAADGHRDITLSTLGARSPSTAAERGGFIIPNH